MMPADRTGYGSKGEYYPLELMVMVMFLFQLIRVGHLVLRQCTSDIFLIDWEKVSCVLDSFLLTARWTLYELFHKETVVLFWITLEIYAVS